MSAKRVTKKKAKASGASTKAAKKKTAKKSPGKSAGAKKKRTAKATRATTAKKVAKKTVAKKPVTKKAAAAPAKAPARKAAPAGRKVQKKARPRQRLNLAMYRRKLHEKQKELLQAYTATKGESRDRQADGTEDYIDYAVSSYDREFLLSLTEMEQKQLMLVEEALKKIQRRGGFGRCAQCDQEIPPKRLDVQPWAKYCVRCQELDEKGLLLEDDSDDSDDDDDYEGDFDFEPDAGDESEDEEQIGRI